MLMHNRFPLTLMTLSSLRANYRGEIELILVDAGSTDETRQIQQFVRGAKLLRFDVDIDFARGCNAAIHRATADSVLFLDNAVELTPGATAVALRRLHSDVHIGAVGGKVIRAHGRLQDAGNIIWRDGTTLGYLRTARRSPEANFVRDVDFAPMFLLNRGAAASAPRRRCVCNGGYAETDLCMRVTEAGYRVVYDPAVVINRSAQAGPGDERSRWARTCATTLPGKHNNQLRSRHGDDRVQVFTRSTDTGMNVLFIGYDTTAAARFRLCAVERFDPSDGIASVQVTVFPINPCRFGLAIVYSAMPTQPVMHDRTGEDLAGFLIARQDYYDAIWIARTHNLDRVKPMIERMPLALRPPRIVLDANLFRDARSERAALFDQAPFDVDTAIMQECANAR
jgi:glycosyltransferase involved in cell wall biosynthesis